MKVTLILNGAYCSHSLWTINSSYNSMNKQKLSRKTSSSTNRIRKYRMQNYVGALFLCGVLGAGAVLPTAALAQSGEAPVQDSTERTVEQSIQDGQIWFERMQHALRTKNFNASLVHVQGQRVELFRWLHGHSEDGQDLEVLYSLNGPEIHIVRRAQRVSYFHPMISPYSVRAKSLFGPIPLGFYAEFSELSESYNAVAMGGARVIDRPAVHVRLVPRDQERFGYSLWLDRETGMLLRMATISPSGDILEQIQMTSVELSDQINPDLLQIQQVGLPPLAQDEMNQQAVQHEWQKNWLPQGFKRVRANHHRLPMTGIAADYFLYSDGMTRISVYVSED